MKFIKSFFISLFFLFYSIFSAYASGSNERELFVVAQRAFEDGFYDVSLRYVEQLLKEFPQTSKRVEANLLSGQCYFFKAQYLKAFNVFQELAKSPEYKDVTLFWLGETYLKVGDTVRAAEQYTQIIEAYPNSLYAPQAFYSLGWSYFEKADYVASKQAFLKLVELFPANNLAEDALFKIAECDYNSGNYEGAVFQFNKYVMAFPNSPRVAEAVYNVAESYYYLEQYEKAAINYERSRTVAVDPKTALASMIGKGWSLFKKSDFEGALKVFDAALTHAKVNNLPEDDILLGQASLYTAQEQYDKAATSYGEIIDNYPTSARVPESYLGRANAFYLLNKYDKAISDYKTLINIISAKAQGLKTLEKARFGLAWTYLKNGNIEQSIESFRMVLATTDSKSVKVSALTQIGDAYQEVGKLDKAVEAYDKVLQDMPDTLYSDYVQYRLGVALLKQGNIDAAILALQALKSNYPNSKFISESLYYLGAAYFKKSNWNEALAILASFISGASADSEFIPEARYLEALSFFNIKNYEKALTAFTEMQRLYPAKPVVRQNVALGLAKVKYMAGNTKEAIVLFEQILKDYPQTDTALESLLWLGDYAMSLGQYEKASEVYNKLLNDFPDHEKSNLAHFELGRAYFSKGELDRALEQYRAVAGNSPDLTAKAKLAIAEIFTKELNPEKASEVYHNIIRSSPEYKRDALIKIAQLNRKEGNYAAEIELYKEALAAPKGLSLLRDVQIQFMLADTYELLNDPEMAIEAYVKIPYIFTKETDWVVKSYLRIAKIYENKEEWDKAIAAYNKVSAMDIEESKFSKERIAWINKNRNK